MKQPVPRRCSMHAAPSLPELQKQFLAALYDGRVAGPVAAIASNGLEPAARLRIYRNSCGAIHTGALRTTYPAVFALVGEDWFDQTMRGYLRAHPSRSGNLQRFGESFADYLETLPELDMLAYLPDVARLEWLRQECVLAGDAAQVSHTAFVDTLARAADRSCITLHPSVQLLASHHPVLTIWRYAMQPSTERLTLGGEGENVVLWREDGEVAMDATDAASFACIAVLARGDTLTAAHAAAQARDTTFDLTACINSLLQHGLVAGLTPRFTCCKEDQA